MCSGSRWSTGPDRTGDHPDLHGGDHGDDRQAESQAVRRSSGRHTGQLNGIVEETFTGHGLVKVFGRQRESAGGVREEERRAVHPAAFGAQFISGIVVPAMMFIGNLNYVVIAVPGWAARGVRAR